MATKKFETKRVHFASFFIAGFKYYEGPFVMDKLKLGDTLLLYPEPTNKHDANAIIVAWKDKETKEEHKLGYVPASGDLCNEELIPFIEMDRMDIFELRIVGIYPDAQLNRRVEVNMYLTHK